MKKLLLAATVGMVVYFFWGMIAWTILQMHNSTYLPFPQDQESTIQDLHEAIPKSGVYYYPPQPEDMSDDQQVADHQTRHEKGPLLSLFILKEGKPVMDWQLFAKSAVTYFVLSFLLAFILQQVVESLGSWAQRTLFVTLIGIIIALASYVDNWIWLYHPLPYVIAMSLDLVIRWIILGAVLALIIKPQRKYKVGTL